MNRRSEQFARLAAAGAVLAIGLVATAVAIAANSATYPDPVGDSGTAADIIQVAVSSDDTGIVTIRIDFPGRPNLSAGEAVAVGLDTDQNPDTGSIFYGVEYVVALEGSGSLFVGRAVRRTFNGAFAEQPIPASLQVSFTPGAATFVFDRAHFGISGTGFHFFVDTERSEAADFAPEIATFNYQFVAGTPAPPLARDTLRPLVKASPAKGRRGATVRLAFEAADNRNEVRAEVQISRKGRVVGRTQTSFRQINPFYSYFVSVRVPRRTAAGTYRFCVRLIDRVGLKSTWSCARLTLR